MNDQHEKGNAAGMFERLQQFLRSVAGEHDKRPEFTADDPRVAMTALFFHVIEADGVVSEQETETLRHALKQEFGLNERELEKLVAAGQKADDEAIDLYRFTSVLKQALDFEHRIGFIESLWEMVYADGVRDELEDNLVWRIAELIGVSDRDRVLARIKVAERVGGDRTPGDE